MKNRKEIETSIQTSSVRESIVSSNEQENSQSDSCENNILKEQTDKIQQLTMQLHQTKQQLSIMETRYATLLNLIQAKDPENQNIHVSQILDKVDELQKSYLSQKIEIGQLKAKIMNLQNGKNCHNQRRHTHEGLIQRKNLNNYFNVDGIRNNKDYLNRKRKNSSEEQENSVIWQKIIQNYKNINSNLDAKKLKDKTLSIAKKFIPHQQRSRVWPLIFQNTIGITDALYIELLQKRSDGFIPKQVVSQIERDVHRSFTKKMEFQNKDILSSSIQQILQLFHIFRPDISYVQGMTYPIVILTTIVGKIKAFQIFVNIVSCNKFFKNIYTFESRQIQLYWKTFDFLLKEYQPEIAQRMSDLKIKTEIFLVQWFFTMFSRNMSIESTLKIWDLFAYQEELVFYKLSLSIFDLIGRKIMTTNYEETIGLIQCYWSHLDEGRLLVNVVKHQLTSQKLNRVFDKLSPLIF